MNNRFFDQLSAILPLERISREPIVLEKHSRDASSHMAVAPDVVVYPLSTAEVSAVLQFANTNDIPVTAVSKGTSLEGNPIPVKKGIVMNMTRMDRILKIYEKDFQVEVEPGIVGDELNDRLKQYNLYFPAFPASSYIATIGGMIANNAGGMYAVKYGVVGDGVLEMEVVLANGDIVDMGSRSIKSVAGYDLKSLFIGSEGTLGVITKATLRVISNIEKKVLVLASFPDTSSAVSATISILHANLEPAAVEFLDVASIRYVNHARNAGWDEVPTILIEFHMPFLEESFVGRVKQILRRQKCTDLKIAVRKPEMDQIWAIRKAVHPSIAKSIPNAGILPGDIGVPISCIPVFMNYVEEVSKGYNLSTATFGHVGDGNFHVWIVYDKTDIKLFNKAQKASTELVNYALKLGGTCTAEHGVGIGKRKYLAREHPTSLGLMKDIKKLLDPKGTLNPGKMFL